MWAGGFGMGDKEKIISFIDSVKNVPVPDAIMNKEAMTLMANYVEAVFRISNEFTRKAKAL
jgi:hypothetical protein